MFYTLRLTADDVDFVLIIPFDFGAACEVGPQDKQYIKRWERA
jgi:hypothetical protein